MPDPDSSLIADLSLRAPQRSVRDPEQTREKIMNAVVQSIYEVGFKKTSGSEISKRAGVSWGAVQHHFGDISGILVAVLERSFKQLALRLMSIDPSLPLDDRVSAFVDRGWEHFGSDDFSSTFEILSHYSRSDPQLSFQENFGELLAKLWARVFDDVDLSPSRTLGLQQFTVATLSGLGFVGTLGSGRDRTPSKELEILKDTMRREFQQAGL
ncbi:MAG: TetR/AcrR family transcriptional regulator [Myxococcota bacterium]|nr:TetR/AcrR family transcriptional regulator [Myxococcota bacterium]